MEKIKRLVFLSAIVVALVMSSCSSEKHKKYIPADSKILGKIDVKAFFEQTDADKDKLMEDIEEYLGDDVASIKDMGIDMKVPIYMFGRGKGEDFTFGIVAKVDDKDQVKDWLKEKPRKVKMKEDDDFDYFAEGEVAIGLNKDAFVFIACTSSEAKKEIKKIMNKGYDGDLDDNEIFKKVSDSKSFACLYADLSIIDDDLMKEVERKLPQQADQIKDLRTMTLGIEGTFTEGICDFELLAESSDSKVQKKIDKSREMFRSPGKKGIESVPDDALGGLVANIDGKKASDYILKALKEANLMDQISADEKEMFTSILDIAEDLDGDLVAYFAAPQNFMFAVESKDNTASRLADIIRQNESRSNPYRNDDYYGYQDELESYSFAPTQYEDYPAEEVEEVQIDDDYDYGSEYDSDYGYGRSSSTLREVDGGYNIDDFWFGNNNGALFFTNSESMMSSAFEKASKNVSSGLMSLVGERNFVLFLNFSGIVDYAGGFTGQGKKAAKAFDEILNKIDYITFSMK